MPRYQYVILLCAAPGREADFDDWYDNQHVHDVAKVEGVVSATRYNVDFQKTTGFDGPSWRSLAVYELETDDPIALSEKIRVLAGTELMPSRGAETKAGMTQIIASLAPRKIAPPPIAPLPPLWRRTEPTAQ